MQFSSLPTTEHPLVALRPLSAVDIDPWARYLNDAAVYEHTSWNHPTPPELASYLGCEVSSDPSHRLRIAIALRQTNELVGTIGFHTVSPENRSAELAYDLDPRYWGKGLATQMAATLVRWAHQEASVFRIQATVLQSNTKSIAVLERLAFQREGLLRAYRLVRGTPGSFYMYAHFPIQAIGA
jgi:[ribosomal protein S5]-alanine N-acetyltransferase